MSIYFMSLTISIHCFVHCLYYLCHFPLLLSLPLLSPFYTNSLFIVIMLLDFRRCVCLSFIFFSFLTKVLTMMKFKIKNIIILYKPRNYLYQHRVQKCLTVLYDSGLYFESVLFVMQLHLECVH